MARLNPRQVREGSLLLVRDDLVDRVFHGRAEHILIKESTAADPIPIEETESEESDTEMVVQKRMTTDRFLPG